MQIIISEKISIGVPAVLKVRTRMRKCLMNTENPFYHNYVFNIYDLSKNTLHWWNMPIGLFFKKTYVQVNDGYAWHFKLYDGKIYLIKYEELNEKN